MSNLKKYEYGSPAEAIARTIEKERSYWVNEDEKEFSFPPAYILTSNIEDALESKEALKHEILKRIVDDSVVEVTRFMYGMTFINDLLWLYGDCQEEVIKELEELGYIFCGGYIFIDRELFKKYIHNRFDDAAIRYEVDEKSGCVNVDGIVYLNDDLMDGGSAPTDLVEEAFFEMFVDDCGLDRKDSYVDDLMFKRIDDRVLNGTADAVFNVTATMKTRDNVEGDN